MKKYNIYKHFLAVSFTVCAIIFSTGLNAQNSCPSNAPASYGVETSGSDCFLYFTWPSGSMPEISCGTPGTPAAGSGSFTGTLIDATIQGILFYDKGNGSNCNGGTFNVIYHPTLPDTYITTTSHCDIGNLSIADFEINRTGSSNFQCQLPNSTPLPVELSSFTIKQEETVAVLNWTTASEINNSRFYVEHSIDGYDFLTIGSVEGAGNSVEEIHYSFTDMDPVGGTNYYRLKQVDFDGQYEYTEIVILQYTSAAMVNFFPTNIAYDGTLSYITKKRENIEIQIHDINGRLIHKEMQDMDSGNNLVHIPLNDLTNGTYFLTTIGNFNRPSTVRFFKSGPY